ncbi:CHASE domain-containing protein [Pseudomonas sp. CAU 1711]|uniref:CHASE domain-containing protein n=1 Tax=Pseudomonas sp. CAU 1711 TaxID=3140356 RepID=UPI0032602085
MIRALDCLRSRHCLATLGSLLLCASLTLALWWGAQREQLAAATERFQFEIREVQFAVEQRLLAYEHVLRGGVGMFAASRQVERDEWHRYVANLDIEHNYPGIQGIGFSKWLRAEERDALVRQVRAEGFADFRLWPEGRRDGYSVILYLEPFDWRNRRAFGFDMYSEANRRAAMRRAIDTGQPAISGKVRLVQETEENVQHGFLMYLPVYPRGEVPDSESERSERLLGFVYAPFRMNNLMTGTLGNKALPDIRLQIFDGPGVDAESMMYDSAADSRHVPLFSEVRSEQFNGRVWTFRFSSLPAFEAAMDTQKPALILGGGLLVSLLLSGLIWLLGQNRSRARKLTQANRGLQKEIGERRRLEDKLVQARDKAEEANRAKSDFLANISHELRTPLTLILAPAEQLLERAPAELRPQLERICRNALLLLNRVNDLLDFAKAEAGKFELHNEKLDLQQWLPILAEDAALVAQRKGCALTWEVDASLGEVWVDRGHLETILLNLLSNALKFTPAGGTIGVRATVLDSQRFQLEVSDTGSGIEAEQLPLLFQRFQQLDNSATRPHGGTGIGLALVKQLVELMGGEVEVHSAPGAGSSFQVRLPHCATQQPNDLAPPCVLEEMPDLAAQLRHTRFAESQPLSPAASASAAGAGVASTLPCVLIADDNPDMRQYLAELLSDECSVLCADDGEQAWELLQRQPVDLLLSDVMMPRLDGLGLTARVKASEALASLPVILITARGSKEAGVGGLECGADDYIAKPFAPEELRARVRAALRMAHTQRLLQERAHDAGMALLAAGILHNLGNVLNGVTVASAVLRNKLQQSKVSAVGRVAALLQEHVDGLGQFLDNDRQGRALPGFVAQLAEQLESEQRSLLREVEILRNCAEHADAVLASQRNLTAAGTMLVELVAVHRLLDSALEMASASFLSQDILIERDYGHEEVVLTDQHRALQILLNLLKNASQALTKCPAGQARIRVSCRSHENGVRLEVQDNGVGIAPERIPLLFNQNPTKQANGHGFGLHLSAIWAVELGGRLCCMSEGQGQGASFTLELPAPTS